MRDVYKKLSEKLDRIPNGFSSTESGVELKILQKIFSPEDAEIALQLNPVPETVEVVAKRIVYKFREHNTKFLISPFFP